jgi:hypothetical protein
MNLGAEELNSVGSCRIVARKELGSEKKASCVLFAVTVETAINPLPGYD